MSDNKITIYSGGYAGVRITNLEFIPNYDNDDRIYKYVVKGTIHLENPYYKRLAHKGMLYIGFMHKARWMRRNGHHAINHYGEHLKKWTVLYNCESSYCDRNLFRLYKMDKSNDFKFELHLDRYSFYGSNYKITGDVSWQSLMLESIHSLMEINERKDGSHDLITNFFVDIKLALVYIPRVYRGYDFNEELNKVFINEDYKSANDILGALIYSCPRCITTIGSETRLNFQIGKEDESFI